jgi:hypothetical protein
VKTPILGGAYVARSVNAAANRMVNLFPEVVPEGGKEPAFLQRCPGLKPLTLVGGSLIASDTSGIRGLWTFGGFLYIASGGKLYRADGNFAVTELGLINGSGPVSMTDNGIQLFVACNPSAFIYNANTGVFAQITDPDFPGAVSVGYLDSYFVFNEPNSQRVWVTSLLDGTSIDPLDFASAEGNPDNIVSLMVDHREVWLFGNNTVEVWYNAGAADFPLARIEGAFMETGCLAPYSVAKLDNSVFWLGSDARGNGIVYRNQGYNGQRISTHAVEWQIQQYGVLSDAIGYSYQQDGHSFYVLTFPTAQATWVFDVATGLWHERAYWDGVQYRRHRSNCQANFAGKVIVGDWETGILYEVDPDVHTDNFYSQRYLRSWRALPTGQNSLKRTAQHALQLDAEAGVGTVANTINWQLVADKLLLAIRGLQPEKTLFDEIIDGKRLGRISTSGTVGTLTISDWRFLIGYIYDNRIGNEVNAARTSFIEDFMAPIFAANFSKYPGYAISSTDPQVMLRWSDDGGHTWSNEHWAGMGKIGEYGKRVIWRRLGMTTKLRDRVYEISGSDPVKIAIMGAELTATPTSA